jgi:hypothetical protein
MVGGRVEFLTDKPEGETLPFMDTSKLRSSALKKRFATFPSALRDYLDSLSQAAH